MLREVQIMSQASNRLWQAGWYLYCEQLSCF